MNRVLARSVAVVLVACAACGCAKQIRVPLEYSPSPARALLKAQGRAVALEVIDERPDAPGRDGTTSKHIVATAFGTGETGEVYRFEPGARQALTEALRQALGDCGYTVVQNGPVVLRIHLLKCESAWLPGRGPVTGIVMVNAQVVSGERVLHTRNVYATRREILTITGARGWRVSGRHLSECLSEAADRIACDPAFLAAMSGAGVARPQ